MINSLEQDLDIVQSKIFEIEKKVSLVQEQQNDLLIHLKETQYYLVKIAKNQSLISKRMNDWPFIAVES